MDAWNLWPVGNASDVEVGDGWLEVDGDDELSDEEPFDECLVDAGDDELFDECFVDEGDDELFEDLRDDDSAVT